MLEVFMLVVMVVVVGVGAVSLLGRARATGASQGLEYGTLRVTGVSPRPAMEGEHYVTLTGTVHGPTVAGEVVYRRFAWDAGQWPSVGEQLTVLYPPGKPGRWQVVHPGLRPYLGS
ncbi:hypothetical protein ACFYTF_24685 [Nocardia thailandica]|uniref:DUF3592 domain-containing protein n=1 Tax=Nocardia thailandica TaxID=257275 RepID=A0ABW6PUL6_9NOCA